MKPLPILIGTIFVALALGGTVLLSRSTEEEAESAIHAHGDDLHTGVLKIPETGPYPAIEVPESKHEFGVMEIKEKRTHEFVIRNTGEAPLMLLKGETTCQCTSFEFDRDVVPAGGETIARLAWQTNYEAEMFEQSAEVHTNDPKNKMVKLTIDGTVTERVIYEPGAWEMGTISNREDTRYAAIVFSPIRDDLEVTSLEFLSPEFTGTYTPVPEFRSAQLESKSAIKFDITVPKGLPAGELSSMARIKVRFGDGREVEQEMPITGLIAGSVQYIPGAGTKWSARARSISLGNFSSVQGKKAKLNMVLTAGDGEEEAIAKIESIKPAFLKAELTSPAGAENKRRKRFLLSVEIPAGSPSGIRQGNRAGLVTISTNAPDEPKIELRVTWTST